MGPMTTSMGLFFMSIQAMSEGWYWSLSRASARNLEVVAELGVFGQFGSAFDAADLRPESQFCFVFDRVGHRL